LFQNCKDLFEQISLQHANLDAYVAKLRASFLDELHRRLPQLELDAIQLHRKVALLPEPDNVDAYAPEPSSIKRQSPELPPSQPPQSSKPQVQLTPVVKQQPIDDSPVAPTATVDNSVAASSAAAAAADSPIAKRARTRASPATVKVEVDETPAELVAAAAADASDTRSDGGNGAPTIARRARRRSADS
jgi:hypothetical protein